MLILSIFIITLILNTWYRIYTLINNQHINQRHIINGNYKIIIIIFKTLLKAIQTSHLLCSRISLDLDKAFGAISNSSLSKNQDDEYYFSEIWKDVVSREKYQKDS